VRHGEGHAAPRAARIQDHVRGAGPRASGGSAPEPGRVRRRGGRGTVRGLAGERAGQPDIRGHRLALGRPGGPLRAGLGGAAPRRAPGRVGPGARVPGRGRPVFSRDPGRLRRDRRGAAVRHGLAAAGRTARRTGRDRGQRAVRGNRGTPVRLGAGLRRRGVRRAAQHVLREPGDGGLATGPAVRGSPSAARRAARPVGAAGLGRGAERGPPAGPAVTRRQRWRPDVARTAGSGSGTRRWSRSGGSCPAGARGPAGSRGRRGRGEAERRRGIRRTT
jgi:collagen type I alpha